MSEDRPRRQIDWNGGGQDGSGTTRRLIGSNLVARSGHFARKAAVPASIGLVGLALIGALAAGPIMRSLSTFDTDAAVTAAETAVEQASVVPEAIADEAPAAASVEQAVPATTASVAATPAEPTPAAAPAPVEDTGLAASDPRWSEDALAVDETKLAALKKAVAETVAAAEIAGAMGNGDGILTGSIGTRAGYLPDRPATPRNDSSAAFEAALVTEDEAAETAAVASADLAPAKATQYVNMRSGPSDEAAVMAVVPANATIEAERDCNWCTVSYNGKQGYIYKSFITR